jgi:hypothetical protein
MYARLKQLYLEIKNQNDLTYKSIPFFKDKVREIRVELLKISSAQGEQLSQDVSDAMRLIVIAEREDLNTIENYPKEIPKYLGRVKTAVVSSLAFVGK